MSGEGLSVSFKRTPTTTKSNKQLLREFQKIVYASPVTKQMKWYGNDHSVEMMEHGDEELQKWQQESVAIKDTFQFTISVYESWHDDADLYESHKRDDSFVSLARKFAEDNALMYFPEGFPSEWIEQEIIDGEKHWNHFIVLPDDKNIDKICEVWHSYGLANIKEDSKELWYKARDKIKQLMEKHDNYEYCI
jgi:hypothetical protein